MSAIACGGLLFGCSSEAADEPSVGYEVLNIVSPSEIVTWAAVEMSQEEFDAIDLPAGWLANQPREVEMDGGTFFRSPGAPEDGPLTTAEHFGHDWIHVATVVETNRLRDEGGLLRANTIDKHHEVTFAAGRTMTILVSPDGELYPRITRDAGRTSDNPTMPAGWRLAEHELTDDLVVPLPTPTINIRADNEDSFQGPAAAPPGFEVPAG